MHTHYFAFIKLDVKHQLCAKASFSLLLILFVPDGKSEGDRTPQSGEHHHVLEVAGDLDTPLLVHLSVHLYT